MHSRSLRFSIGVWLFLSTAPPPCPFKELLSITILVNDLLALTPEQLSSLRETSGFFFPLLPCSVYLCPGLSRPRTYTEGFPAQGRPWLHFPHDPRTTLLNTGWMSSLISTDLTSHHRSLKHSLLSKQKGLVVLFVFPTSSSFKLFLWTCTLPFVSYGCSLSSWYYTCSNTLNFSSPVSLETLISLASLKDPYLLKLSSWLEVSSLLCLAVSQLSECLFL